MLLPCPFCGCQEIIVVAEICGDANARCCQCHARGPLTALLVDRDKSFSEAVRVWNNRSPATDSGSGTEGVPPATG